MSVFFQGWGPNFLGWAGVAAEPPPPPPDAAPGVSGGSAGLGNVHIGGRELEEAERAIAEAEAHAEVTARVQSGIAPAEDPIPTEPDEEQAIDEAHAQREALNAAHRELDAAKRAARAVVTQAQQHAEAHHEASRIQAEREANEVFALLMVAALAADD